VFPRPLNDTVTIHLVDPDEIVYFQPHDTSKWVSIFTLFQTEKNPIRIFFTPTTERNRVTHCAWLTGIRDKTRLLPFEIAEVERHLPGDYEGGVFGLDQDPPMRNLLHIKAMRPFKKPVPVETFLKYSDGHPLGGGSYLRYKFARIIPPSEDWIRKQLAEAAEVEETYMAEEGVRYAAETKFLKRNRRIVREAQAKYQPVCEACGDRLENKYGRLGLGYIQFHHRKPLGDNPHPVLNSWRDLAPLCPNCHTMIHRTDPVMSVEDFKKRILDEIVKSHR
jgi:hypothetical protein